MSYARERGIGVYGRDLIAEWGNTLFYKRGLFEMDLPEPFEKMMRRLNYEGAIIPHEALSEGGLYIFGKEFILVSDHLEPNAEFIRKTAREAGPDVPVYFLPSITSQRHGHIDCDYQFIDSRKLLYASHNVFHGKTEASVHALAKMKEIARRHNYWLKEYLTGERNGNYAEMPDEWSLEDAIRADSIRMNGINLINSANAVLTGSMHSKEKRYLQQHGVESVVVPLGKVGPGAGLRCVYGEFNLSN